VRQSALRRLERATQAKKRRRHRLRDREVVRATAQALLGQIINAPTIITGMNNGWTGLTFSDPACPKCNGRTIRIAMKADLVPRALRKQLNFCYGECARVGCGWAGNCHHLIEGVRMEVRNGSELWPVAPENRDES